MSDAPRASDSTRTGSFPLRTIVCASLALLAFAANSVLCRLALGSFAIDAATFSALRLASGAGALLLMVCAMRRGRPRAGGSWGSGLLLSLYAIPFSYAYLSLSAGTGALLLFGSVQATMLLAALLSGERPHALQWLGWTLALAGLLVLVLPGVASPPPGGSALMIVAGIAWGVYSLRGRAAADPLLETSGNFARAALAALLVSALDLRRFHAGAAGVALAVLSGAIASGGGYVLWYAALKRLSATRAAVIQLPVPVLAATGGVIFLAEDISARLVGSSLLVIGGVGMALAARERHTRVAASN